MVNYIESQNPIVLNLSSIKTDEELRHAIRLPKADDEKSKGGCFVDVDNEQVNQILNKLGDVSQINAKELTKYIIAELPADNPVKQLANEMSSLSGTGTYVKALIADMTFGFGAVTFNKFSQKISFWLSDTLGAAEPLTIDQFKSHFLKKQLKQNAPKQLVTTDGGVDAIYKRV